MAHDTRAGIYLSPTLHMLPQLKTVLVRQARVCAFFKPQLTFEFDRAIAEDGGYGIFTTEDKWSGWMLQCLNEASHLASVPSRFHLEEILVEAFSGNSVNQSHLISFYQVCDWRQTIMLKPNPRRPGNEKLKTNERRRPLTARHYK